MGLYKAAGITILPILAFVALLSTHKAARDNGLFALIDQNIKSRSPVLPNSSHRLQTSWTGLARLDYGFALMNSFFAPCLDGKTPALTVQSIYLLGQLASVYTLMFIESVRVGNAWKLISFISVFGILGEWIVMAFGVPVFCLLHLLTSPTVQQQPPQQQPGARRKTTTALLVHPIDLQILPVAVAIGHLIPAHLQLHSSAAVLEPLYKSRQFWTLMRLLHPVWTSLVYQALRAVCHSSRQQTAFPSPEQRNRSVVRGLNRAYSFARLLALVPHVGALTLLALAQLAPALFASKSLAVLRHPGAIFTPPPFWLGLERVRSISRGAQMLLQWDLAIMAAAVLVWAFVVNRETLAGLSSRSGASSLPAALARTLAWLAVGGPAAAAISLLKERDQILLDQIEDESKAESAKSK